MFKYKTVFLSQNGPSSAKQEHVYPLPWTRSGSSQRCDAGSPQVSVNDSTGRKALADLGNRDQWSRCQDKEPNASSKTLFLEDVQSRITKNIDPIVFKTQKPGASAGSILQHANQVLGSTLKRMTP